MSSHEFVKVYDSQLPNHLLVTLPPVAPGESKPMSEVPFTASLDKILFEAFTGILNRFRATFPTLNTKWVEGTGDRGYQLLNPVESEPTFAGQDVSQARAFMTIVVFLDDRRTLDFPLQGLKIRGKLGRIVVFPAYWTHPYKMLGEGTYVLTQITYPTNKEMEEYEHHRHPRFVKETHHHHHDHDHDHDHGDSH